MSWLFPIRMGDSNRTDLTQLTNSFASQRGNAFIPTVGSLIWIECRAMAIAIDAVWIINQKMINQMNPDRMSDMLSRWEAIFGIIPLPSDTLYIRRNRVGEYFFRIGQLPNLSNIEALMTFFLPDIFVGLVQISASSAIASFPAMGDITDIIGGTDATNGPWSSTVSQLTVEVQKAPRMTLNDFDKEANQIFNIFKQALPAFTTYDWMYNSFCDDGHTDGYVGLISIPNGSKNMTSVNTAWNTPINSFDNTYNLVPGSVIECFDDNGVWRRMTVDHIISDTHLIITTRTSFNITNQPYVMQGFFLDCDPTLFPYPPTGCLNVDNAGFLSE